MTLNVRALFSAMQICAREWIATKHNGSIVNIASIFGMIADPLSAPYAASKGAVIQLTKTCAMEWARHGIRVNAVAPGYTHTAMTAKTLESEAGKKILGQVPMKRAATVEEIANAVLFLASDAARFVTGQTLVVNGGRTLAEADLDRSYWIDTDHLLRELLHANEVSESLARLEVIARCSAACLSS
jgi:NAD(P)-dependent dehydrogenase (short-subunit alcohol dehydrogenase family)